MKNAFLFLNLVAIISKGSPQSNDTNQTDGRSAVSFSSRGPVGADELIKKVPPYRPPGAVMPPGIHSLVDPILTVDMPPALREGRGRSSKHPRFHSPERPRGPFFDKRITRNVTALAGKETHLVCRVKKLRNHTVSWIRHRDTNLLTVGRYTYTTDQRFESYHRRGSEDWILTLRDPKTSDAGIYGCQISTTPHRTRLVHLTVLEAQTHIIGGPDMFVDVESMLNLSCVVSHTPNPPSKVKWVHQGKEISFRGPRDGVSIIMEKAVDTTIHLLMQGANHKDSGIYKCLPDNAPEAQIKVHILDGGNQVAGLQTNGAGQHSMTSALHKYTSGTVIIILFSTMLPLAAIWD